MSYDPTKYAVLYVDDEAQALKYFRKAFEKDFTILTASNVQEALTVVEEHGADIGVLVTDQRMPVQSGTELLEIVKRRRPEIVRILTTAYSDIDSAIEAVNSGGVFRYVSKPWDLNALKEVLLKSMELFILQRERDLLLRQKFKLLKKIVVTDRVRALTALTAGLGRHIRNSLGALEAFLNLAPQEFQAEWPSKKQEEFKSDLLSLAKRESNKIFEVLSEISNNLVEFDFSFSDRLSIEKIILPVLEQAKSINGKLQTRIEIPGDLPPLMVDEAKVKRLFELLAARIIQMKNFNGKLTIRAQYNPEIWETEGVSILIASDGHSSEEDLSPSFFNVFFPDENDPSTLSLELLSAFFIAHRHGGDIVAHRQGPNGPGFEVLLPLDPEASNRSIGEKDCLEKAFWHFDAWDAPMKET